MLLRFGSTADWELVRGLSLIDYVGAVLTLERPGETSNPFFRQPQWLAYVMVADYPLEHWDEDRIKHTMAGFCDVLEIAPTCLTH